VSALSARGLTYTYPFGPQGLIGVDIDVDQGEVVGVIGPNGAGKSTLLRILTGLIRPDAGSVEVAGKDLRRLSSRQRARTLAFVPQVRGEAVEFEVGEMAALGRLSHLSIGQRLLFSSPSGADGEAIRRALADTDLEGLAERPYTSLSGGEQARARLAMAFAQDALILVLDEPTAQIDQGHAADLMRRLRRRAAAGRAVVAALHDINLASAACDRLIVLGGGRVVAEGAPNTVLVPDVLGTVFGPGLVVGWMPDGGRPAVFPDFRQGS